MIKQHLENIQLPFFWAEVTLTRHLRERYGNHITISTDECQAAPLFQQPPHQLVAESQ